MSFQFIQLADPQFGMFASLSGRSSAERRELFKGLRDDGIVPDADPEVPASNRRRMPKHLERAGA